MFENEKEKQRRRDRMEQKRLENRSLSQRNADARQAHRGNDPRAGIRAYCAGNRWLTENAQAVGNW